MKHLFVGVVLLLSVIFCCQAQQQCLASFPDFATNVNLTLFDNSLVMQCTALCTSTCVNNTKLLSNSIRCLTVNQTTKDGFFSDLRKFNGGLCVILGNNSIVHETIATGDGNDCIWVNGSFVGDIETNGGNDLVFVSATSTANNIRTGAGEDYVAVNGSVHNIDTGRGNDTVFLRGAAVANDINLGGGNDYLVSNATSLHPIQIRTIRGGSGSDVITLNYTIVDTVLGGPGSDYLAFYNGTQVGRVIARSNDMIGTAATAQVGDIDYTEYSESDDSPIPCKL